MIQVRNLSFEYPGHRVLHQLDFTLEAGSVTALVGPNGAGKTTLLRCLAALERPLEGSIHIAGIDTRDAPREVHRQLGFLTDFFGLYEGLNVAQCLRYAARSRGIPGHLAMAKAEQAAERLGLADRLQAYPGQLSRGLRQRLAIAQAIVHEPPLLLLDEPASGLDPEARDDLAGLFRSLNQQGMTLLVSSHILSELDAYSTHLLALRDGRIRAHRPLTAAAHELHRVRVGLCEAPALRPTGEAIGALAELKWESDTELVIGYHGDAEARHQLLTALLAQGLKVSSFAPLQTALSQLYFDRDQAAAQEVSA